DRIRGDLYQEAEVWKGSWRQAGKAEVRAERFLIDVFGRIDRDARCDVEARAHVIHRCRLGAEGRDEGDHPSKNVHSSHSPLSRTESDGKLSMRVSTTHTSRDVAELDRRTRTGRRFLAPTRCGVSPD